MRQPIQMRKKSLLSFQPRKPAVFRHKRVLAFCFAAAAAGIVGEHDSTKKRIPFSNYIQIGCQGLKPASGY